MEIQFTAVAIAAFAGLFTSLFFAYFPKVRVWFASLEMDKELLIKLGLMICIEGLLAGLSFVPGVLFLKPPFTWQEAFTVAFALIVTNQPVANLLPATKDVKTEIAKRIAKFFR